MQMQRTTRHYLAVLAVLASCGLSLFAGPGDDKKAAPKPLPPEIVKAWRDAGFDVGWMKDVPPESRSWGFWRPWREKGEAGSIPAFDGHLGDALAKLPAPDTVFGLDFHCGACRAAMPLKELTRFKSLQSLNIGAVLSGQGKVQWDFKDLAKLTNLRALYLFYLPVTDADLKHVAGLKNLQVLDLASTQVTDAGLKELAGLKSLQWLNLRTAGVTAKGIAALQKDLPKCKIITYDD